MEDINKQVTPKEFARLVGVEPTSVYRWIHEGFIKSTAQRKGRRTYYKIPISETKIINPEH